MTPKRPPRGQPYAFWSLHVSPDGEGVVAYEKDGVVEIERVASCSCTWLTFPEVKRLPDPFCKVPGHDSTP